MAALEIPGIGDWARAVEQRDAAWDGKFVYAVTSTGIFCRPSCPSRRPRRKHLRFFLHCGQALSAGYRACRRCDPQGFAPGVALATRVCRLIEANSAKQLSLAELARAVGLSPSHLQRSFKASLGITPRQYGAILRRREFERLLSEGIAVSDALFAAGYGSVRAAYETPQGLTPATYGAQGRGARIRYTVTTSPLGKTFGKMLVAATDKGVCAIRLASSRAELIAEVHRDFARAELGEDAACLGAYVNEIVAHLKGRRPDLRLPLDIRATAFQHLVWSSLQQIPRGETRSYSEVAEAIGRPNASRAVARACASNSAAVAIPCHRVVRRDGGLGGYRWGIDRKQALLEREQPIGDNQDR